MTSSVMDIEWQNNAVVPSVSVALSKKDVSILSSLMCGDYLFLQMLAYRLSR